MGRFDSPTNVRRTNVRSSIKWILKTFLVLFGALQALVALMVVCVDSVGGLLYYNYLKA